MNEIELFFKKFLTKKQIIFFNENNNLFFKNENDIYTINLNNNIINTIIYKNKVKLKFDFSSLIDLYKLIEFKDNKFFKKYFKKANKFIKEKDVYDILNKFINKEDNLKFYKIKFIDGKYAKHHDIEFNNKEFNIKKNVKNFSEISNNIINIEIFIDILKKLITCKNITFFQNYLIFEKENDFLIKYNFDFKNKIEYNNEIYFLNYNFIKLIYTIIYIKNNFNTKNNLYKLLKQDNLISFKKDFKYIVEFNNIFSIYDIKLYKTIIKFSKQEPKVNYVKETINNSKLKIVKKSNKNDFLFEQNNFGTLGEFLGKNEVIIKDEIVETNNFQPYFKNKLLNQKEKENKKVESLVLWDLENINYFDDFSIITRFVKNENQLKIVAFSEKYRDYQYLTKLNFELNKLKKRNWIIKETKKIADNVLIEQFHKYKKTIKELILVSNDSDFKEIIEEANNLGIKTIVLYRHGHKNNNYWYNIASERISLKEIM